MPEGSPVERPHVLPCSGADIGFSDTVGRSITSDPCSLHPNSHAGPCHGTYPGLCPAKENLCPARNVSAVAAGKEAAEMKPEEAVMTGRASPLPLLSTVSATGYAQHNHLEPGC